MMGRIGSGWPAALRDLEGPERRLWVSAYVTDSLHSAVLLGDRVLIRGAVRDFAYESSNLEAIRDLLGRGVEVRTNPRLHAKVYVREIQPRPIAWIGSANLTTRGRSDGTSGSNLEAMSGPVLLEPEDSARLEAWWGESEPLTLGRLTELADAAGRVRHEDAFDRLIRESGGILSLHVVFSAPERALRFPESWFDPPDEGGNRRTWSGVGVTVPFRPVDDSHPRRPWPAVRNAVMAGLRDRIAEPVKRSRQRFAVDVEYRQPLIDVLDRLNAFLGEHFRPLSKKLNDAELGDFVARASAVLDTQSIERRLVVSRDQVQAELSAAFTSAMEPEHRSVSFSFTVPIGEQDRPFREAADRTKQQSPHLFPHDRRQQVEQLMTRVQAVLT